MTRKDHLVELTAALVGSGRWTGEEEAVVETAGHLLAEIEKVCLDTTLDEAVAAAGIEDAKDLVRWCTGMRHARGKLNEAMAQAAADERERCAKIVETVDPSGHTAAWVVQQAAAAIRRNGAAPEGTAIARAAIAKATGEGA